MTSIKQALDEHPGIAVAALGTVPSGPNALELLELTLALLDAGGVDGRRAVWAAQVLSVHVVGSSWERGLRRSSAVGGSGQAPTRSAAAWRAVDPAAFPHLTPVAPLFRLHDEDERFAFGLELVLDGLVL